MNGNNVEIGISEGLVELARLDPGVGGRNLAGILAHEGRHGVDGLAAGGRNPLTVAELLATERLAYVAGDYVRLHSLNTGRSHFSGGLQVNNDGSLSINRALVEQRAQRSLRFWCGGWAEGAAPSGC